jgi:hypothetical protein
MTLHLVDDTGGGAHCEPTRHTPPTTMSTHHPLHTRSHWLARAALSLALTAPFVAPAQAAEPAAPLQTIERLEVGRYLGTWYEIGHGGSVPAAR